MGDEPHVGLVDPHAERDRRDHHETVLAQEPRLVRRADPGVEARVVRQRRDAVLDEVLRRLLDRRPGQAVDDPGVAGVLGSQEVDELGAGLVLADDPVLDVGPVEARHEVPRRGELQSLGDLGVGRLGGGRRQGDARHRRPAFVQHGELQVVGAEVVAPLGHAVSLVDGEQRDGPALEQVQGVRDPQALGREVEQVERAVEESALDAATFGEVLGRVEEPGPDTKSGQRIDLVLHEGDQRRDDDAGAGPDQCRDLVAQGLPAAGRHQDERVAPGDDGVDDLGLVATEVLVAEHAAQHRERGPRRVVGQGREGARVVDGRRRGRHGPTLRVGTDGAAIGLLMAGMRLTAAPSWTTRDGDVRSDVDASDRSSLDDGLVLADQEVDGPGDGRRDLRRDLVDLHLGDELVHAHVLPVGDEPRRQDSLRLRPLGRERREDHVGHRLTVRRIAASIRSCRGRTAYSSECA
ncbi:hypothetical protein GALL_343830 [mine drainage metagenome]|uniref:Uncharacterized protein n=1 Tax=mine drainage metagenome TaxID=410659 RepID=A0A1J5QJV9_9ZZZZ